MRLAETRKAVRARNENRKKSARLPIWRRRLTRLFLNPVYDWSTACIVVMNTIFVGFTTDNPSNFWFWLLDFLFIPFVTCEMTLKLYAFGPRNYFKDPWNKFDCLVSMSGWVDVILNKIPIFETNEFVVAILQLIRIFRIARRMARIARTHKDLRLILSGIIASVKALLSVVVFLVIVHFCFSVTFVILYSDVRYYNDDTDKYFGSTYRGMISLFQVMTFESWVEGIVNPLEAVSPGKLPLYFLFIIITSFGLLNILTAVIVENAIQKANFDAEEIEIAKNHRKLKIFVFLRKFLLLFYDKFHLFDPIDNPPEKKHLFKAATFSSSRKWSRLLEALSLHKKKGFNFLQGTDQNDYITTGDMEDEFEDDFEDEVEQFDENLVHIQSMMDDATNEENMRQIDNQWAQSSRKYRFSSVIFNSNSSKQLPEVEQSDAFVEKSGISVREISTPNGRQSIKKNDLNTVSSRRSAISTVASPYLVGSSLSPKTIDVKRMQILGSANSIQELLFCDPILWSRFISSSVGSKKFKSSISLPELIGLLHFTDVTTYGIEKVKNKSIFLSFLSYWNKFHNWLFDKQPPTLNPRDFAHGLTPNLPAIVCAKVFSNVFDTLELNPGKCIEMFKQITAGASAIYLNSAPPVYPGPSLEDFEEKKEIAFYLRIGNNFIGYRLLKLATNAKISVRRRRMRDVQTLRTQRDHLHLATPVNHKSDNSNDNNGSYAYSNHDTTDNNSSSPIKFVDSPAQDSFDSNNSSLVFHAHEARHPTPSALDTNEQNNVMDIAASSSGEWLIPSHDRAFTSFNKHDNKEQNVEVKTKIESKTLVDDSHHSATAKFLPNSTAFSTGNRFSLPARVSTNLHQASNIGALYGIHTAGFTSNPNIDSPPASPQGHGHLEASPLQDYVPPWHPSYTSSEMKRRGICDLVDRSFNALKGVRFIPSGPGGKREVVIDTEMLMNEMKRSAGPLKSKDLLHLLYGLRATSNDTESEISRVSAGIDGLQKDLDFLDACIKAVQSGTVAPTEMEWQATNLSNSLCTPRSDVESRNSFLSAQEKDQIKPSHQQHYYKLPNPASWSSKNTMPSKDYIFVPHLHSRGYKDPTPYSNKRGSVSTDVPVSMLTIDQLSRGTVFCESPNSAKITTFNDQLEMKPGLLNQKILSSLPRPSVLRTNRHSKINTVSGDDSYQSSSKDIKNLTTKSANNFDVVSTSHDLFPDKMNREDFDNNETWNEFSSLGMINETFNTTSSPLHINSKRDQDLRGSELYLPLNSSLFTNKNESTSYMKLKSYEDSGLMLPYSQTESTSHNPRSEPKKKKTTFLDEKI